MRTSLLVVAVALAVICLYGSAGSQAANAESSPVKYGSAGPLTGIGIVMLGVRDVSKAIAFYRDRLGLKLNHQHEGFAFLQAGAVTLCLSEALPKATGRGPGATELVFPVDHVKNAYADLQARGVEFTNEPRVVTGTSWAANFQDPDGHLLSIFGPE